MAKKHSVTEKLKATEMPIPVQVRLYICTNHDGENGSSSQRASVVVARDQFHAQELLDKALLKARLLPYKRKAYTLSEISLEQFSAEVLADGDM
jgi:hypothetical protein